MTHVSTTENTALAAAVRLTDAERQRPLQCDPRDGLPPPRGQFQHGQTGPSTERQFFSDAAVPLNPNLAPGPTLHIGGIRHDHHRLPRSAGGRAVLPGLPWRCSYCRNPELLDATTPAEMDWPQVLDFLRKRQACWTAWSSRAESHPATGLPPQALGKCAPWAATAHAHRRHVPRAPGRRAALLDWVGLDIKGPEHRYADITSAPGSGARAFESLTCCRPARRARMPPPGTPGCMRPQELQALGDQWLARACATGPCRFTRYVPGAPDVTPSTVAAGGAQIPHF